MVYSVVSLHLDFSRHSVRRKQVHEIVHLLSKRGRLLIVMGDYNSEWRDDSPLRILAGALDLRAYRYDDPKIVTFSFTARRFDWILISKELRQSL